MVVQHQRQVGLGGLDLGFGLGLDVGIDREGNVVGFVDGRRLGTLLAEAVALLQRDQLQFVNRLDDLVEFLLQPLVVADIEVAGDQQVEGLVEVLSGGFQVAGIVVGLPGRLLLLGLWRSARPPDRRSSWA